MVVRSKSRGLNIWMNGIQVGTWQITRQLERFSYSDEWISRPEARPLSLSLPFLPGNEAYQGDSVDYYFDNLLPDSDVIRRRLASRYQVKSLGAFDLLSQLGRDCVGAIQLLPEGELPAEIYQIQGRALSNGEIADHLRRVSSDLIFGQVELSNDLRLSIAGAQEKTALLKHDGRWFIPQGSTPTTHIFKLPLGLVGHMRADMRTSVENEWLCSKIMAAYGIPTASCEIGCFEDQKVLIVERFDRRLAADGQWIMRLPQEDFCQALGISPMSKYQADGGPSITSAMKLLLGSVNAEQDRIHFFKTQIIFWILAATDGHGKNFSIAHLPGAKYQATPIYDVLSAHPVMGFEANQIAPQKAKLAMAVRGTTNHYLLDKIHYRHWLAQAQQAGLGANVARQLIGEVIEMTGFVINQVRASITGPFPLDVADSIFTGMEEKAQVLASQFST
ncbi:MULTISPECIES: type II toxin-antitoxin system HipA family toxin [unclassified Polynucleobacter]|uniref:type II toxin-antitoxin system HipA family toxin n=1 Tax=unclassified Polynucleobacter TaxID=2640945 RepID=UPI0008B9ECF4|nr:MULTISPECIES: type II toxin-antitoxin system HipA family toxin [unclassified Polynucleobacter]OHC10128.1 MAG: toxin HipA [Polynucleobacter sp. GWA2_45_21]HBK43620.1 toxin HipA [Polynucleobacter sp.]